MNKREKFLFILLAAAVILFGGYKLLISPSLTSFTAKGVELIKLSQDKKASEKTIDDVKSLNIKNIELENTIKTNVSPFFPELKNDKIQIWVESLAVKSNININVLNMAQIVTAQITNPISTYIGLTYPASEFVNSIDKIKSENSTSTTNQNDSKSTDSTKKAEQKASPNDLIEMVVVSIQFNGTYEQATALLDQIKSSERIARVTSLNIIKTEKPELDIKITLECFGIKKFTQGDVLSENSLLAPAGKANPFA